ncbi:MAG: uL15 family ribosomal protein [Clostridia bacterium]|nr:uL15 family ribosomal protein [Clostridia bacterium]
MAGALLVNELVVILIISVVAIVALGVVVGALVCRALLKKNAEAQNKANEEAQAQPAESTEDNQPADEAPVEEPTPEEAPAQEPVDETPAEEPVEEIVEETPVEEPAEEPVPVLDETEDEDDDEEEEFAGKVIFTSANRLVEVRYDKSYTARLIQTSDKNKSYYSELKNELLRYRRVKSRISWKQESFRKGRDLKAKMEIRGKTLCLYLALDPAKFEDGKYIVEDASDVKRNLDVPCKYRIKNDRRLRYAKELIAMVFEGTDAVYKETEIIDYAKDFPYEETQPLLERELIKLIRVREDGTEEPVDEILEEVAPAEEIVIPEAHEVTAAEAVKEMKDEVARLLVRESGNVSLRGKQTIVNVDTLGEYFNEGETVTLDDMRERIPFLNKSATWVKVLARGRLSKALVVEADDFSLDAIKMIVLAGGTVYRKREE